MEKILKSICSMALLLLCVTTANAASKQFVVLGHHAHICLRSSASDTSKINRGDRFDCGDWFAYEGEEGDYYKVAYDDTTCYLPKRYGYVTVEQPKADLMDAPKVNDLLTAAKNVAQWYFDQNTPYQADGIWYESPRCPYSSNAKAKRDCSGFVSIVLQNCGVFAPREAYNSISFIGEDNACAQSLKKAGYIAIRDTFPQEDFSKFLPGDILAVNQGATGDEHHVTIYAGDGRFYDYGGKAPGHKQPISGIVSKKEMNPHTYTVIWRKP